MLEVRTVLADPKTGFVCKKELLSGSFLFSKLVVTEVLRAGVVGSDFAAGIRVRVITGPLAMLDKDFVEQPTV